MTQERKGCGDKGVAWDLLRGRDGKNAFPNENLPREIFNWIVTGIYRNVPIPSEGQHQQTDGVRENVIEYIEIELMVILDQTISHHIARTKPIS